MTRQPNASYEGAGQRQVLGMQEVLGKIGSIQILNIAYINADSQTNVAAGGQWTDVTATIPAVSGATGYYFIPISSNYGAVSQITMNGREVTCIVRNVSGETHTCRVRALAVAYKTV